jgi:hypothetical protein
MKIFDENYHFLGTICDTFVQELSWKKFVFDLCRKVFNQKCHYYTMYNTNNIHSIIEYQLIHTLL